MPSNPIRKVDWFDEPLPEGPWGPELRLSVGNAILRNGWKAVADGDTGHLSALYGDFASIYPRLMHDVGDLDQLAEIYSLLYLMIWRKTQVLSDLKPFNDTAVKPFATFLREHFPRAPLRRYVDRRPRVAYLTESDDLDGSNAVGRITVSLMMGQKALRQNSEQPVLYCIGNNPQPSLFSFCNSEGITAHNLHRSNRLDTVGAVLDRCAMDDIDILVSDNCGAIATMTFQRKAARIQAFHENGFSAWKIAELDAIMLGITKSAEGLVEDHVAVAHTPRNTALVFQRRPRLSSEVDDFREWLKSEAGVDQYSTLYGFYGRMPKVTTEYLAAVERILAGSPESIFFAGGSGRAEDILEFKKASPFGSRILVKNEFVDGHLLSEIIDVFLDTFPFPGGMSCIEVQARGKPVVWMTSEQMDKEFAIIHEQRDAGLKAGNLHTFVAIAIKLNDPAIRDLHKNISYDVAKRFSDVDKEAEEVECFLASLWSKAKTVA